MIEIARRAEEIAALPTEQKLPYVPICERMPQFLSRNIERVCVACYSAFAVFDCGRLVVLILNCAMCNSRPL